MPAPGKPTSKSPARARPFDLDRIRQDFPILDQQVNGHRLVYLDNAATSQKPSAVLKALDSYYRHDNANVKRAIHALGERATERFENARLRVQRFIKAPKPHEVIFVRNATEAINLVAYSWGRKNLHQGDEIIATEMEHHSNLVPWQVLSSAKGARLRCLEVQGDGCLDLQQLESLLNERTRLVCMAHVSNVLGTINPIQAAARLAHRHGALLMVDGAQGAPHLKLDMQQFDCDFYAFSGHKMLGPTGVGVLYGKEALLEEMDPFLSGGEMIREVFLDHATWGGLPGKFEAGTPNIAQAIGLAEAVTYLEGIGMGEVRRHDLELTRYALSALQAIGRLTVYGPRDAEKRVGVVTFNDPEIHPHDLATILDQKGIAIRVGHHCAQPLMRKYGVAATARSSFYIYNSKEEIDCLVDGLAMARQIFHRSG